MTKDPYDEVGLRLAAHFRERLEETLGRLQEEAQHSMADLKERAARLESEVQALARRAAAAPGTGMVESAPRGPTDTPVREAGTESRTARSRPRNVEPRPRPARRVTTGNFQLAPYLTQAGLAIIDKRSVPGGNLWVTGEPSVFEPIREQLAAEGIDFIYVPNGSRATGGRPGWYTKSPR